MLDGLIQSGLATSLTEVEIAYLKSFLDAGDRGGFYMAYYSLVGADDPLMESGIGSDVGKLEASLQTKIATFSGQIGATAYLANRLLEEATNTSIYPGIYYISQEVAKSAYKGVEDSWALGNSGLISDERFFATADAAWERLNLQTLFPGRLIGANGAEAAVNTIVVMGQYITWAVEYINVNGTLPTRADVLGWASQDGARAAALATVYVALRDVTGKQVSDFAGQPGYTIVETPDGNQTFVVNAEGHVIAGEADPYSNGSSNYEDANLLSDALKRAVLNWAVLSGVPYTAAQIFSLTLDPLFAPHMPESWADLVYPVGEERVSQVDNYATPYAFRNQATSGNDTLTGTASFLGIGGADTIDGGQGNDAIFGGGGDDVLIGGDGNDLIWGNEQEDELRGGGGDDVLRGGEGDDIIKPGLGNDIVDGGSPDIAWDQDGKDTVDYSDIDGLVRIGIFLGSDYQRYVDGNVIQVTDTDGGADTLFSIERIVGTNHADTIKVAANGTGLFDELEWIDLGDHNGLLENGQRPVDTIDLSDLTAAVTVDLRDAENQLVTYHGDGTDLHLRNVEAIIGTDFSDTLYGIAENDAYGAGSEILGGDGDDVIYGGKGVDRLVGGSGADWIEGGDGNDILYSGDKDSLVDDGSADRLIGGKGVDRYFIDGADDRVIDPDFEAGETITFGSTVLTGGKSARQQPNIYTDEEGTRYEYETGADDQPVLKVTRADGLVAHIELFLNGEAGIWLRHEDEDGLDPESFLSPLVLDLDGDGLELSALGSKQTYFDFGGDGFREMTAWVNSDDGLLAWDRDGNGKIDNASELFGANPFDFGEIGDQPGGMARLAELDSNHDGIINGADSHFVNLRVWQDANGDGETQPGELKSLADLGIISINLDYFKVNEAISDSFLTERSSFIRSDGTVGEIADIWFRTNATAAVPTVPVEVDADIVDLPYIGSSGLVRDLHSAMQLDPLLEEMVQNLVGLTAADAWQAPQMIEAILLRWTGADEVRPDSRGQWFDARYLTAVENWTGDRFIQQAWNDSTSPYPQASAALMKEYRELLADTTVKLLAQTEVGSILLPELDYAMDAFLILDPEFSAADFAARAAANAPSDAYQQIVYWHGVVTAAEGLAVGTGFDPEVLADAIDTVLSGVNPQLSYDALHRMILGGDGDDRLIGTSNELTEDFANTDPANWTLPDVGGVDWIVGGPGNDRMAGGYGRDTYVFGRGFGQDTVYDNFGGQYDGSADQDDVVQLIGDLTLADIQISVVQVEGREVARIAITGSEDRLDFELAGRSSDERPRRESIRIVASDGTFGDYDLRTGQLITIDVELSLEDLQFERIRETFALAVKGPDGTILAIIPDYFSSTREQAVAFTLSGTPVTLQDIDVERLTRAQTSGNDLIEDTPRSNIITGLGGNDTIMAGKGDDVIDGGAGADVLRGDRGTDTYLFGRGSGVDTVIDPFGLNVVQFGTDVALTDLQLSYGPNGTDLVVRIAGTQDQLVVMKAFGVNDGGIETFRFADGSSLSRAQVKALLPAPTPTSTGLLNQGTNGVDTLGAVGPFTLAAGLSGRDIYRFNRGDGVMVIGDTDLDDWDWRNEPFTNGDIIQFGEGITVTDLKLKMIAPDYDNYIGAGENSIEITIEGTSDVIRVHSFSPYWYYEAGQSVPIYRTTAIDELRFADGQVMNLDQIFAELQRGTSGDDVIRGWLEGAVLDGGSGNDDLSPGFMSDVSFKFGRSSGQDRINELVGRNQNYHHRILFDEDINPQDLKVSTSYMPGEFWAHGFDIGIEGSDASLSIRAVTGGASFVFADGTIFDPWQMAQLAVDQAIAGSGTDIQLYGWSNYTEAGSQVQTIALREGMGEKRVSSGAANSVNITLPQGMTLGDLNFAPVLIDGKLYFRGDFGSGNDAILISNIDNYQLVGTPPVPDYFFDVSFSDGSGTTLTNADILSSPMIVSGDTGNNLLVGTSGDELFNGRGGTDTLLFGYASGQDVARDLLPYSGSTTSYRLKLAAGTDVEDITIQIDENNNARIGLKDGTDTLGFYWYQLTEFETSDGAIWSRDELLSNVRGVPIDPPQTSTFHRGDGIETLDASINTLVLADVYSLDELDFSWEETPRIYPNDAGPPITEDGDVDQIFTITIRDTGDSIKFGRFQPDIILADGSHPYRDIAQLIIDRATTNGDDVLRAPAWSYVDFDGRGGNDILDGYLGATTYYFGRGYGTDTIIENGWWFDSDWDVIQFNPDVTPNDVTVDLDPDGNLIFQIAGTDDKLIVPSFKQRIFEPGIEEVLFDDGTSWLIDDVLADLMVPTSGDDVIFERYGDGETPTRWDQLVSSLMDGGAGNDFLAGGAGNDFYVFGRGYGQDTILDKSSVGLIYDIFSVEDYYDSYPDLETDTLTFLPGILPEDLQFLRGGRTGNDLIIRIRGTEDQVTIVDQFAPLDFTGDRLIGDYDYEWQGADRNGNGRIDLEELDYVPLRYLAAAPNGIEAIRFSTQQVLTTTDIAGLVEGTDNSGDNTYWTDGNGGTLDGGAGNDLLTGGTANDDFVFARGYGEDEIRDTGGYDIVNFGTGVRQSYLHFSRVGEDKEDLLIEVDGPERLTLKIDGQFAQIPGVVEEFTFLTGEYLTWIDVQNIILAQSRTAGNDQIQGFLTDDIVDGGEGDDTLIGWKGDDTIIGGAGRDIAAFSGARENYLIEDIDGAVRVTDLRPGMDGVDTLYGVEELRFEGGNGTTESLVEPNRAPLAVDAAFSTSEEAALIIQKSALLSPASDPDGDALVIVGVGNAVGGRAWINLAGDLVFDPSTDFFGTGGFDFTISDGHGGQAIGRAVITISGTQDAPRLSGIFQEVTAYEDMPIDVQVPAGLFMDPDGDQLALSATLLDGTPLPEWLSFANGRLTGQPPANFNGSLELQVSASDGQDSVANAFTLRIVQVNDAPVAGSPLPDIQVMRGQGIEILLPSNLFSDPDEGPLEIGARQVGEMGLPRWLLFDGARLFGEVPADFFGELHIEFCASDGEAMASSAFIIAAAPNQPPIVDQQIGNLSFNEDAQFSVVVPNNLFVDPDADPLSLSLTLSNGGPLPEWLHFDGETISGQAPANFHGVVDLKLSATDGQFNVFQQFSLAIQSINDAPAIDGGMSGVSISEDSTIDFIVPSNAFKDVDGDALTITAKLIDGSDIPSWLMFDGSRFTGNPPANFNGSYSIRLKADDGQAYTTADFVLSITAVNDAPTLAQALSDAAATIGAPISIAIPTGAFADVDGDTLSLSATLEGGGVLPAWLSFANGVLSGTAPAGSAGSYNIRISATDGQASAFDNFLLAVSGGNPPALAVPLPDVSVYRNAAFDITIPSGTFVDPDGDALTYSASLADGSSLPSWISFANGHFTGTVPSLALGTFDIRVVATDGSATVADTFRLSAGIQIGAPNDRIVGGGVANTNLDGQGGDDWMTSDNWNVRLIGGAGNDILELLGDDNYGQGGTGSDYFLFDGFSLMRSTSYGTQWATIEDFQSGIDKIGIVNGTGGVYSFADLQGYMAQSGAHVVINLKGLPQITVQNVTLASLGASDFWFGTWGTDGGFGVAPVAGAVPWPNTTQTVTFVRNNGTDNQSERIVGNGAANTTVQARDGNDWITADNGGVTIFGDRGNDVIELFGMDGFAEGGPGYDYFVFDSSLLEFAPWETNWAHVGDYHDSIDKIVFLNGTGGLTSFAALQPLMSQSGDDVIIALSGLPVITIEDTTLTDLDAGDFLFVNQAPNLKAGFAGQVLKLGTTVGLATVSANGLTNISIASSNSSNLLDFTSVTLTGITLIDGKDGDDVIIGSASADTIQGGTGNDTLSGGAGDDVILGGTGDDILSGGDGNDLFKISGASEGFDAIQGGAGTDTIAAQANNTAIGLTALGEVESITGGSYTGVYVRGSGGDDLLDFTGATLTAITKIDGGAGSDIILGSAGNDVILGSAGDDTLSGGGGNDTFQYTGTAAGNDVVDGGVGTDSIVALANSTIIRLAALSNVETISGGSFTGVKIAGSGNADVLDFTNVTLTAITSVEGGTGDDTITGNSAANTIAGGAGNDLLSGAAGNDTLTGDEGDDTLFGGTGNDVLNGGDGIDWVDYSERTTNMTINLATTSAQTVVTGESDTISNVENVRGGAGSDTLTGNGSVNILSGGSGNDTLSGAGGNDTLIGGSGNDVMDGGTGTDTVDYSYATAALTVSLAVSSAQTVASGETDTITNVENLVGGSGNDTLTGSTAANILSGGAGADRITGGAGNDTIDGGSGSDIAVFAGLSTTYSISTVNGNVQIVDNATTQDGNDGTDTLTAVETVEFKNGVQIGLSAPIILDLDGDGVNTLSIAESRAHFDFEGNGSREKTSWFAAGDGLLFLDRDGNDTVSGASEFTFINDVAGARSDLEGLRAFDSNGDGLISARDGRFADFRIWADDGDGVAAASEIISLEQAGVASVSLTSRHVNGVADIGDVIAIGTGEFTRDDGSTAGLLDAMLAYSRAEASRSPMVGVVRSQNMLRGGGLVSWFKNSDLNQERLEIFENGFGDTGLLAALARTGALSGIWAARDKRDGSHSGSALTDLSQAAHNEAGVISPLERTLAIMRQDMASFGSGMGEALTARRVSEEQVWPLLAHG